MWPSLSKSIIGCFTVWQGNLFLYRKENANQRLFCFGSRLSVRQWEWYLYLLLCIYNLISAVQIDKTSIFFGLKNKTYKVLSDNPAVLKNRGSHVSLHSVCGQWEIHENLDTVTVFHVITDLYLGALQAFWRQIYQISDRSKQFM